MVLYSVAAIIGMFTVQSTMQTLTQFTEWQVAHQFMVLYGVFGFWALGIWQDLLPRLAGKEGWFSDEVNEWGFWLNLIGVGGFVTAGLVGGIAEGGLWQSNVSWAVILDAMATFWEFQLLMLGVIIVANAFLIYNSVMTLLPAATIQELTRTAE
jgi:cbb3-type cytochrome oxidase subunit 1